MNAECGMRSAELMGKVDHIVTLPCAFRIPHSAFRTSPAREP